MKHYSHPTPIIPAAQSRRGRERRGEKKVSRELKQSQPSSVKTLDHGILHAGVNVARALALTKSEHALNDTEFSGSGIKSGNGEPVVDNHAGADDVGAAVDTTGDKGNLKQAGKLILVLDSCLGVNETTLVRKAHVTADEHVISDRLSENLDSKDICNDLFRLTLQIRVD